MEMTDVCFAPVLSMAEAPSHPHNVARQTFVKVGDHLQPGPAPRFSETPSGTPSLAPQAGGNTAEILKGLGKSAADIEAMQENGIVG